MSKVRWKSRVGEWRKYSRFRRFQIVTTRLLLVVSLGTLMVGLLLRIPGAQSLSTLAQTLNQYSNLALVLLTLVLVTVTSAYVWLTRSILLEMSEARRAEVRPFLRLMLHDLEFRTDTADDSKLRHMALAVVASNHGRGPVVNVRVHVTVPHALDEKGMPSDWIAAEVKWSGPPELGVLGTLVGEAHLFMPTYVLPDRFDEFLEIEARYEDALQALFCLRQYYDLFSYGASRDRFALILRYESLYYWPHERRTSVLDTDMRLALAWGEKPVHERRLPWSG